jgi:Tfp pilus assembly protein PilF
LSKAEIARARQMLNSCLTEDPLLIEAQFLQCSFAAEAGDLEGAEQACRRALYIDRQCPMGHFHLALIQNQRGDHSGCQRSLKTTLQLIEDKDPHALVDYGEGVCYGRLKELARSLSGFPT